MQNAKKIVLTGKPARTSRYAYVARSNPVLSQMPIVVKKGVTSLTNSDYLLMAVSTTAALLCELALDSGHETMAIALATISITGLLNGIEKTFRL